MTEKELFQQLKSLKTSEKAGALPKARGNLMYASLMAKVDMDSKLNKVSYLPKLWFLRGFGLRNCFQYAAVTCLIFFVGIAGCLTTVSASFNSLPGDTLYQIKIATEKMQLVLAQDEAMKINLQTEFAGRRIEEMTKIVESDSVNKEEIMEKALSDFKSDFDDMSGSLEIFGNDETTTGTIKFIGQKIDALNEIVIQKAPELSDRMKVVKGEIDGIMIDKGMSLNPTTNLSEQNVGSLEATTSTYPRVLAPEIPEAPKKVQWQIIIKE